MASTTLANYQQAQKGLETHFISKLGGVKSNNEPLCNNEMIVCNKTNEGNWAYA